MFMLYCGSSAKIFSYLLPKSYEICKIGIKIVIADTKASLTRTKPV